MIGAFPTLYPGELLYSVYARHCDRMQYPSKRSAVGELFSTANVIASVELPSHIDDFVSALPWGHHYSADDLIDNHTLLPFYGPFLPSERLHQLRQDMRGRNGPAIHMRVGNMASHVSQPEWLRLCLHCIKEDRRQYGECYWHRVHQLPGVEVCPIHEAFLCCSGVRAKNVKTRYEFLSAECAAQQLDQLSVSKSPPEILLNIAHDASWLLSNNGIPQSLKALNARYRAVLGSLGFASYRGRTNVRALLESFQNYYPPDLLHLLQCELDERVKDNWLLRLIHTPRNAQHPLHHLLLIYFLGYTAETFLCLPTERKPFGEGPWPCLNTASSHYHENQVKECYIDYTQQASGKPVGTFSCNCGFIYTRTGPDTSVDNRFTLSRVKAYGSVWEHRLRVLWNEEVISLRGISRQLGVDPLTVKRHATRIGLPFPRPVCQCLSLKETRQLRLRTPLTPELSTRDAYRDVWVSIMQENLDAGVRILRGRSPGVYTWLYRNDRVWLKEHTPLRKKTTQDFSRVDWNERDKRLAEAVRISALRMRNALGRPVQVTFSAVGRDVGQLALFQQHLDKLPLTKEVLTDLVETREGFAIRRIGWVVTQYRQKGIQPVRWELIRQAGVERLKTHNDVRIAIDEAIQFLSVELMNKY